MRSNNSSVGQLRLSWELSKLQKLAIVELEWAAPDRMDNLMRLPSLQSLELQPSAGGHLSLPGSLCSMTSLEALSLECAQIAGDTRVLGDLAQLKTLKLHAAILDGGAPQVAGLCWALSQLQQLSHLTLGLAGTRGSSFHLSTLSHLSKLTALDLAVWHLESAALPAGLSGLQELCLCARTGLNHVYAIADLEAVPNLAYLNLESEEDDFQVTESLVSLLGALPRLRELYLTRYNLQPWSKCSNWHAAALEDALKKRFGSCLDCEFELVTKDPSEAMWVYQ